jgi:hypothetical protein
MKEQSFIDAMKRMGFYLSNYNMDPVTSMAFTRRGSNLHILEFSSGKAVAIYNSSIYLRADDLSTLLYVVAANFYEEHMQELEDEYLQDLADMYEESLLEEY